VCKREFGFGKVAANRRFAGDKGSLSASLAGSEPAVALTEGAHARRYCGEGPPCLEGAHPWRSAGDRRPLRRRAAAPLVFRV
jgi:hypothetical protein